MQKWQMRSYRFIIVLGFVSGMVYTLVTRYADFCERQLGGMATHALWVQFTGLTAIASVSWHLLIILIAARLHRETWRKSFVAAFAVSAVALTVFYFCIAVITHFRGEQLLSTYFPVLPLRADLASFFFMLLSYMLVALPVCTLFAILMRIVCRAKSKLIIVAVVGFLYVAIIWTVYNERMSRIIRVHNVLRYYGNLPIYSHYVVGNILQAVFPAVLVTFVLYIILKDAVKNMSDADRQTIM